MNYSKIVSYDICNGTGWRVSLFVSGCSRNCPGCFNPQTHDPEGGFLTDTDKIYDEFVANPMYEGITFSGGEPFLQSDALADLAIKIKRSHPDKTIICYTGYTYEQIKKAIDTDRIMSYMRLLYNIDYLIDGRFDKDKASLDCKYRGSTNQRIIDVKMSIAENMVIPVEL